LTGRFGDWASLARIPSYIWLPFVLSLFRPFATQSERITKARKDENTKPRKTKTIFVLLIAATQVNDFLGLVRALLENSSAARDAGGAMEPRFSSRFSMKESRDAPV
jgi:hypothetical protein